jgi:hypothetical protein
MMSADPVEARVSEANVKAAPAAGRDRFGPPPVVID